MDPRRHAPATERNGEAILEVLREILPERGRLLEVASGSGQHAAFFAPRFPGLVWQPSDVDASALASTDAWTEDLRGANVPAAIRLDVLDDDWGLGDADASLDAIFNANMIHISPWSCCLGLLGGAARHLRPGGVLVMYGPYRIGGEHTALSNADFDCSLREQDAAWGVRDLEEVERAAAAVGLGLRRRFEMPANNQTVVFRRGPA